MADAAAPPVDPIEQAVVLKNEANAEFAAGEFLKAAALYSKAIKLDVTNAALYSNRSIALLKLKKVSKALEDAEECIRLRPEWEKGYYRKAAVLEDQDKLDEAIEVYKKSLKLAPAADMEAKIKQLQKLSQSRKKKMSAAMFGR
ncbi:hypothetical protein FOA52_014000 [Chlamydomonas sp. UWO 241]|nr:hypothetical protein FOA52_014000 [Chlamydomonas sp. UWO 241]